REGQRPCAHGNELEETPGVGRELRHARLDDGLEAHDLGRGDRGRGPHWRDGVTRTVRPDDVARELLDEERVASRFASDRLRRLACTRVVGSEKPERERDGIGGLERTEGNVVDGTLFGPPRLRLDGEAAPPPRAAAGR